MCACCKCIVPNGYNHTIGSCTTGSLGFISIFILFIHLFVDFSANPIIR